MADKFSVSVRNTRGIVANFHATDKRVQQAVKRVVRDTANAQMAIATTLVPVDTGFMRDNLTLEFLPSQLGYAMGWREEDFLSAGRNWYAHFVEFGTSKMAPQPSLLPSLDAVFPQFRRNLRRALRLAKRRRGAA